ncbi:TetR/AcrR family transcriptional regulator [Saccharomonospora viridis]|jgi:AcrR family transcriptional regulator|uniref:Transcriptional regulator n=2 Tax=Saccharomonospora viridis TaxID=1852 RepID=C7MWX9_SACVD|nr:TetR family transcriptional regulator C-terminal domain-containing protein [Saccharomonospora viridis]ACU97233.1 transcriptional regulator [Saccharomonospora viridis DSM 43017]KHF43497.1 transcriptional regulator [Saccharomonospora viridis]SFO78213.1 transcriptional regulator, TetR family [Saccharomonospora viridis]
MGHREALLAAARRLLRTKGYAHITARDLVAESGTNLASIGYHFGSKAGLLNEAIGEAMQDWTEQLARIAMADPAASTAERGLSAWSAMLEGLVRERELVVSYLEALAQAEREPVLREQFAEQYRRCRARVAELVAESLGEGARPDDPSVKAVASFVIAVCDGLAVQWVLDPDELPTGEELRSGVRTVWDRSHHTEQ